MKVFPCFRSSHLDASRRLSLPPWPCVFEFLVLSIALRHLFKFERPPMEVRLLSGAPSGLWPRFSLFWLRCFLESLDLFFVHLMKSFPLFSASHFETLLRLFSPLLTSQLGEGLTRSIPPLSCPHFEAGASLLRVSRNYTDG